MPNGNPPQTKKPHDLADSIVSRIELESIHMRSHTEILAEALGWAVLVVLVMLAFVIISNILSSWFRFGGFIPYLSFGQSGFLAFWEGFPVLWFLLGFLTIGAIGLLLRHYDISYKKPFPVLVGLLVFGGLMSGMIITNSGRNRQLEEQALRRRLPKHVPMIDKDDIPYHHGRFGIVGQIIDLPQQQQFVVQIDDNRITVVTTDMTRFISPQQAILRGDIIRAVGHDVGDSTFQAEVIQEIQFAPMEP